MKVLVTGGAGYLGSILCQLLLQSGHEVRALDILMYGGRAVVPVAAITLPLYPGLEKSQVEQMTSIIRDCAG